MSYYDPPWYKEPEPWILIAVGAICVILLVLAARSDQKFAKFAAEHNCKSIAQDPSYYMTTLIPMSCGNGCTTYMPIMTWIEGAKTWRCDGIKDFKR